MEPERVMEILKKLLKYGEERKIEPRCWQESLETISRKIDVPVEELIKFKLEISRMAAALRIPGTPS